MYVFKIGDNSSQLVFHKHARPQISCSTIPPKPALGIILLSVRNEKSHSFILYAPTWHFQFFTHCEYAFQFSSECTISITLLCFLCHHNETPTNVSWSSICMISDSKGQQKICLMVCVCQQWKLNFLIYPCLFLHIISIVQCLVKWQELTLWLYTDLMKFLTSHTVFMFKGKFCSVEKGGC